jgi:hypothetical protein
MFDDLDAIQPVLAPAIAHPLRERAIARRTGDVRLSGQEGVRVARPFGRREREKAALDPALSSG